MARKPEDGPEHQEVIWKWLRIALWSVRDLAFESRTLSLNSSKGHQGGAGSKYKSCTSQELAIHCDLESRHYLLDAQTQLP